MNEDIKLLLLVCKLDWKSLHFWSDQFNSDVIRNISQQCAIFAVLRNII